jgi:hypothetical protein
VLSALAHAAAAPTGKIGPRPFKQPNAALFFSSLIIVDLRALLRMRVCQIDNRG